MKKTEMNTSEEKEERTKKTKAKAKKTAILLPILAIFMVASIPSGEFLSPSYMIKNIIIGMLLLLSIFCLWYSAKKEKES